MRKRKMAVSSLDETIAELARKTEHKTLAIWAADCAERVLHYFEESYPEDNRPREAIETLRTWVATGIFKMAVIRGASLGSHAAARETADYSAAHSAARAAGQAVATAHVPDHAIAAAIYAATAVRNASEDSEAEQATLQEREWQYQHLLELNKKEL